MGSWRDVGWAWYGDGEGKNYSVVCGTGYYLDSVCTANRGGTASLRMATTSHVGGGSQLGLCAFVPIVEASWEPADCSLRDWYLLHYPQLVCVLIPCSMSTAQRQHAPSCAPFPEVTPWVMSLTLRVHLVPRTHTAPSWFPVASSFVLICTNASLTCRLCTQHTPTGSPCPTA